MEKCLVLSMLLPMLLCRCQRDLPLESTISLEISFPTETLLIEGVKREENLVSENDDNS